MRDNTTTPLRKGPTGPDQRILNVESARQSVESVRLDMGPSLRPSGRPAHVMGLFLTGTFKPSSRAQAWFASDLFTRDVPVVARLSPLATTDGNRTADLHGLAIRFDWPHEVAAGHSAVTTDLVALNIKRFMFRNADDFALFFHRLKRGKRHIPKAAGAFVLRSASGNTSSKAMLAAILAARKGADPIADRSFWGLHTFFADVRPIANGGLARPADGGGNVGSDRIPFRYRLDIVRPSNPPIRGKGNIRSRYVELADWIDSGNDLTIRLEYQLPWQYRRLMDWEAVPKQIRQQIISPMTAWNEPAERIAMGEITLRSVVDRGGLVEGGATTKHYDEIMFDPTRLAAGLYPSDDPLLAARSGVYEESHMRRI